MSIPEYVHHTLSNELKDSLALDQLYEVETN